MFNLAHELTAIGRAMRPTAGDAFILGKLHLMYGHLLDLRGMQAEPLANRLALHRMVRDYASPDGRLLVAESGRDCDGVQYAGQSHLIEASVKAYDKLCDDVANWADGPFNLTPVPWGTELQYVSRDLTLEAFEDGHAHCIHTTSL
jgi:hypothetical protein